MVVAAPVPAQAQRRRTSLPGVFVYWHFLSLDAPTVAVVWAWSFAWALGIGVPVRAIAVLGVGTWMIYVVDRLLDVRRGCDAELRERHFFHARHRRGFWLALGAAGMVLAWLIAVMTSRARQGDFVVFMASLLYFAAAHSRPVRFRGALARPVAVGVLFAGAVAVPAWSSGPLRGFLVAFVILFAGLCSLNCLAIEVWERLDRNASVSAIAIGLALASLACGFALRTQTPGETRLAAAALCSALLLLALDLLNRRFTRLITDLESASGRLLALRIAADAALLTPVLLVLPWRP